MLESFRWLVRCPLDRLLERRLARLNAASKTLAEQANRTEFHRFRKLVTATRAGALGLRAHFPNHPTRPQPKAAPRSPERCELGQHSSLAYCFPVARAIEYCTYTSASNRISEQISCCSRPEAPAAAQSSPGTSRSEDRSEEEDVFVGAIRPCRARESKSQICSPPGPNTVATTTARSSNRSGQDSTNANEGSSPLVFGTGFDNFDGCLP